MNKYYNSIAPKKISLKLIFYIFTIFTVTMPLYSQGNPVLKSDLEYRRDAVSNVRGTFNSVPRLENGRADLETLIEQLVDLNVNTYFWWIWHSEFDWEDLHLFLPLAKRNSIKVWVGFPGPAQTPPRITSMPSLVPYGVNYQKWVEEIALLSLEYSNLVAWSLDDVFGLNLDMLWTPEYIEELITIVHEINPRLAFVACVYYNSSKIEFVKSYEQNFDAILFPYKADSSGKHNLRDTHYFKEEIASMKSLFTDKEMPFILDIYSMRHYGIDHSSSAGYVGEMIELGKEYADGIMIYTHPDVRRSIYTDKYFAVKEGFKDGKKDYPITSYHISRDGVTLYMWTGPELYIDMTKDSRLKTVERIYSAAFQKLNLDSIKIGDNTETILEGHNPFWDARNLKSVIVNESNKYFNGIDGVLYSKDNKILYAYPYSNASKVMDEIIEGTEIIKARAFGGIKEFTTIIFPESLKEIHDNAFSYCSNVEKIELGENISYLHKAFSACYNIKEIVCKAVSPPRINEWAWGVNPESVNTTHVKLSVKLFKECVLYVPEESVIKYKNAFGWSDFKNIRAIK